MAYLEYGLLFYTFLHFKFLLSDTFKLIINLGVCDIGIITLVLFTPAIESSTEERFVSILY